MFLLVLKSSLCFSILFLETILTETAFNMGNDSENCDISLLINDANEPPTFINFSNQQKDQQINGIKIKTADKYRINCITRSINFQFERITIVNTNNLMERKILTNLSRNSIFDGNNLTMHIWYIDMLINQKDFNFTNFYIECAYFEPTVCNRTFSVGFNGDKIDFYNMSEKNTQRQSLKSFIWILSIVLVLTSIAIILRLFYTRRQKIKRSRSSVRNIYKPTNSKEKSFKPRKSSSKKNSVDYLNDLEDVNNRKIIDGVEIPIIYESNEYSKYFK